jgi:ribosome-associated translation inhibitor RaiA
MELNTEDLMYEFHAKDLSQPEALKQYADHAVKEIKSIYGWDTYVQINIEPEAKDKHLFSVSMSVFGLREPIIVRKDGKHVLSILRKVRKTVMRQIHRLRERKANFRRKSLFKEQLVFLEREEELWN